MIIKVYKQEIEVNEKDIVLSYDNGIFCFENRWNFSRFVSGERQKIGKSTANKWIKNGTLILIERKNDTNYYKFNL
jgi:hypothetical protein